MLSISGPLKAPGVAPRAALSGTLASSATPRKDAMRRRAPAGRGARHDAPEADLDRPAALLGEFDCVHERVEVMRRPVERLDLDRPYLASLLLVLVEADRLQAERRRRADQRGAAGRTVARLR